MPAIISGNGEEGGRIGESSRGSLEGAQEKNSSSSPNGLVDCDWCGAVTRILWVHGQGQCLACGWNIMPCCEGTHLE